VARRFWTGDPIGRRLRITWNQNGVGAGGGSEIWLTVVGVVGAVRFSGVDDDTGLDVYAPHTQIFAGDSYFVLRSASTAGMPAQIRAAIDRVDAEQSFFDLATMEERVSASVWQQRVSTAVLTLFAVVSLALAIIGTYAVTAHAVAAQRREIGIRLALGSSGSALGWILARAWLIPVSMGVVAGLAGGALGARVLASMLGVSVPAVGWPLALPAALAAAATVASALPVFRVLRRATLVEALRAE
jgi:hypothetical protein